MDEIQMNRDYTRMREKGYTINHNSNIEGQKNKEQELTMQKWGRGEKNRYGEIKRGRFMEREIKRKGDGIEREIERKRDGTERKRMEERKRERNRKRDITRGGIIHTSVRPDKKI